MYLLFLTDALISKRVSGWLVLKVLKSNAAFFMGAIQFRFVGTSFSELLPGYSRWENAFVITLILVWLTAIIFPHVAWRSIKFRLK